jgi:hypothetical protein
LYLELAESGEKTMGRSCTGDSTFNCSSLADADEKWTPICEQGEARPGGYCNGSRLPGLSASPASDNFLGVEVRIAYVLETIRGPAVDHAVMELFCG